MSEHNNDSKFIVRKQLKFTVESYLYDEFAQVASELGITKVALLRLMLHEFLKNYRQQDH